MNESILLEAKWKHFGNQVEIVNWLNNGHNVEVISTVCDGNGNWYVIYREAIKKWEDSSKDIIDAEKVLSKHASNYAKTVEKDEKPLYFLQLNGHEAINAMKEYASQFQPIVGELLKVYQAIKMTGANIRPLKIINERISELEKIINHGK